MGVAPGRGFKSRPLRLSVAERCTTGLPSRRADTLGPEPTAPGRERLEEIKAVLLLYYGLRLGVLFCRRCGSGRSGHHGFCRRGAWSSGGSIKRHALTLVAVEEPPFAIFRKSSLRTLWVNRLIALSSSTMLGFAPNSKHDIHNIETFRKVSLLGLKVSKSTVKLGTLVYYINFRMPGIPRNATLMLLHRGNPEQRGFRREWFELDVQGPKTPQLGLHDDQHAKQ